MQPQKNQFGFDNTQILINKNNKKQKKQIQYNTKINK